MTSGSVVLCSVGPQADWSGQEPLLHALGLRKSFRSTFLLSEVKLTLKPTFKWRRQASVGEYHNMLRVVLGTHQVQERCWGQVWQHICKPSIHGHPAERW